MTYKKLNDLFSLITRKTIFHSLEQENSCVGLQKKEKQRLERAPLVFLKDRFIGPQNTRDPKLG